MNVRKLWLLSDNGLAMAEAMKAVLPLANAFSPLRSRFMVGEGSVNAVVTPQQILGDRFFIEDASRSGEEL
jgi:hypothetical protein